MTMTEPSLRRFTGLFGMAATLLVAAQLPLYFLYEGAPPTWCILTRILLSMIGTTVLIVFHAGFRQVVRTSRPDLDLVATIGFAAGLMWLVFSMVAQSMEAGATIVATRPIDPTVEGPLAPGQFLLYGSIGRLMTSLFLIAAGFAIRHTRFLPDWIGLAAWVVALCNLAFVPSLYFGSNAAQFYSAVGWGTTATAPMLAVCWIFIASVSLFRSPSRV